jgi:hypothetical protein
MRILCHVVQKAALCRCICQKLSFLILFGLSNWARIARAPGHGSCPLLLATWHVRLQSELQGTCACRFLTTVESTLKGVEIVTAGLPESRNWLSSQQGKVTAAILKCEHWAESHKFYNAVLEKV